MIDVLIVGAGPGGMTAAIYAVRANLRTVMVEKGAPGGKMTTTYEVENWPGTGIISGADLSLQMFNHTQEFGVEYEYGNVVRIESKGSYQEAFLEDGSSLVAKVIIIASGMEPRVLGATHEERFMVRGISFCAVCDGAFYKNREVVVLGGGNSAMEEAIFLTTLNARVTLVHHSHKLRADKVAVDSAMKNPLITFKLGYKLIEYLGQDKMEAVRLRHVETGAEEVIPTDGVFMFIGHIPKTEFVKHLNITDDTGFIKVNSRMETGIDGLYAIGDVTQKELRQIVTATADGAIAAQNAVKYIEALNRRLEEDDTIHDEANA